MFTLHVTWCIDYIEYACYAMSPQISKVQRTEGILGESTIVTRVGWGCGVVLRESQEQQVLADEMCEERQKVFGRQAAPDRNVFGNDKKFST